MLSKYCGFVTIVGRPNVGKSTLLNYMMGKKLSITCHKPQTTRLNLYGIKTKANHQAVFIDTPGLHLDAKKELNRLMNKQARSSLIDIDVVVFMVEANRWTDEDEAVLKILEGQSNVILVINKIDSFKNKRELMPYIEKVASKLPQATVLPLSASKGEQVDVLEKIIFDKLPQGPFHFPEDMDCSHNEHYRMTEIVREKILRQINEEIPYCATVQIEKIAQLEKCLEVNVLIWVEREGQKKILIGEKGANLKNIGIHARQDIEKMIGQKVMLKLWIKVKKGWSDSHTALGQLGFHDMSMG